MIERVCYLCREESVRDSDERSPIPIFSAEGARLNVSAIIAKHLWLLPQDKNKSIICWPCWEAVRSFHEFYERVAEVHKCRFANPLVVDTEDDPLPPEITLLKSEALTSAGQLVAALGDSFFDSEVKVEVHDLELLPQAEIIEDEAEHVKEENTLPEPEIEVSLDVLMNDAFNCSALAVQDDAKIEAPTQKRRRGRPRKCNVPTASVEEAEVAKEEVLQTSSTEDDDADEGRNASMMETEDSASSTSSDEVISSNSDDSLPDVDPPERYAEIPKRVVVKPKKYRKREKPLVPPRRLTREEIDSKKAQQTKYDKVIAQFFDKFPCPLCNLLVQNFGDMKRHFRITHKIDPGYMMCCGRKFHLRKTLAEHVYVHWNPEHFKCGTCSRVLQDSRALEVHALTHSNPPEPKEKKLFQCDKCPKNFTTKAAFEHHAFSKHVPKSEFQFTCEVCDKKLPTARKLKDHMKYMHDPESAIICDKCGKQVRSQTNLRKHHELEHSEAPRAKPVPMQCELCGTWLRHLAGLKQHMKSIHEDSGGEHRCHICNKMSTNARALKRHIYHNHECERKFKCTMCEKAFKRPQDLREHTSTHTGEVLYTCPNCPMTFFSNANMYKHRQRLHRAEWEADRKRPGPPIMQQAVAATAAMKKQQAVGAASAFFARKKAVPEQRQEML